MPLPRPRDLAACPVRDLLVTLVGVTVVGGVTDALAVTGVTQDSRDVHRGDLYAALPGARVHGADFVAEAAAAGAQCILTDPSGAERCAQTSLPVLIVEQPRRCLGVLSAAVYGDPSRQMALHGVTGTNGKTTTAFLLEAGLRGAGLATGLLGTVETRIGDLVLPSGRTTPEAPELQALLAVMAERGTQAVAMEVSSHALALGRVDGAHFATATFTNLSQDHLDFHPSLEEYFQAKASLFTTDRAAVAVVNLDDPHGQRLVHRTRLPSTTFSVAGLSMADWRATKVETRPGGTSFRLLGPGGEDLPVSLRMLGIFNVANAVGALAALASTGVELTAAIAGIEALTGVPGRMERIDVGQPYLALVDYAHTPEALDAVLAAVRPISEGKVLVVIGCGGDRDVGKRPLMGAAAALGADVVVLTDDNPRSEDSAEILSAMERGARAAASEKVRIEREPDRGMAITLAVSYARPGDVLVVAGKGHETGQDVHGVVTPFDDRLVLRAAIEHRSAPGVGGR